MSIQARLLPLALLALAACKSGGGGDTDAGTNPVEDLCNSREEALSLPECELKPGEPLERFLVLEGEVKAGDQDWYRIVLPADTSPRTLLNVNGAYLAASTAVNLSITVLGPLPTGGEGALAKKEDQHGQGAPKPVDMVLPLRDDLKSQTLLVLVQDAPAVVNRPNFDAKNKYRLTVQLAQNPDSQEPNDTYATATPLTLAPGNGQQVGTATGYLATDNDVDHYTFNLEAGKVAYVRVHAPDQQFVPNWRLSYELRRPGFAEKEDEGQSPPGFRGSELATARKVKQTGTWMLVVKGYRGINDKDTALGDLRQRYEVEVRALDEADAQDSTGNGNDRVQDATARNFDTASPGTPQASASFTGRLGYVPDRDWYSVRLPVSGVPTLLRYRLVPLGSGGRFPALPDTPDRTVQVFTLVSKGANLAEWRTNCLNDASACPRDFVENQPAKTLAEGYCTRTDLPAPMCLHSYREEVVENPRFTALSNFHGVIPLPPHTTAVQYYFLVQDDGSNWADDRDYRLEVSWEEEDLDERNRQSTGSEQPVPRTLQASPSFPAPPYGDTNFSVTGQLSHGHGRLRSDNDDRTTGMGVRGPWDYDAVPSDIDSYQFQLPPATAPEDKAWLVQWEVDKLADGGTPHGISLAFTFCEGDVTDGGTCTPVTTGSRSLPLTMGYRSDSLRAWHTPSGASFSSLQPLYTREERPGSTVVTVAPYACGCLERRFIRGGTMRVDVSAESRTDYERVNYTLRTGYAVYPTSYTVDGGASVSCPAPVQDGGTWVGGCNFTRQP
ncbi:hypothetical protein [Myxococcus sp. RHSTA-1-4]|uniref:hypothetical protein n=1 Tax=Myxococcus sp. RHSTA-1-4 TaxID=2874601 RepID=UPI001CBD3F8E|nr:hypothetical protein [Myxococcus sp. RHSTA-1-4]MBZ4414966.1 hypothetical protein [Myxococcus sp. RHSTA-1-4]